MKNLTVRSTAWLLGLLHLLPAAIAWRWGWLAGLTGMIALHAGLLASTLRVHSRLFGTARRAIPPEGRSVCLTIDDGPCGDTLPLLDILDAYQAKAVFFLIGERAASRPGETREILRRGHLIGNHTRTHPAGRFWSFGPRLQRREIGDCQKILQGITGNTPAFFRAPAGFRNPFTAPVLRESGLEAWGWSARGYDTSCRDVPLLLQRLTANLTPGAILLIHQGQAHHPELLGRLLEQLAAGGWSCRLPPA